MEELLLLVMLAILYFPSVDMTTSCSCGGDTRCAEVTAAHISLPICQSFSTWLSSWGYSVEAVVQMHASPRMGGREKSLSA